eukprot:102203_1
MAYLPMPATGDWEDIFKINRSYYRAPFQLLSWNEKLYAIIINEKLQIDIIKYNELPKYIESLPDLCQTYDNTYTKYSINYYTGQLFVMYRVNSDWDRIHLIIYDLHSFQTTKVTSFKLTDRKFSVHRLLANNKYIKLQNQITFHVINYWKRKNIKNK